MTPGKNVIAGVVVTSDNCSTVSLILSINLLPVFLSPAIIVHQCCWYQQKIYHRCHNQRSLFTSVVDKFIAGVIVTDNDCAAVSTTPVINLLPVSTILPITGFLWQRLIAGDVDAGDKFVSRVVDTTKQFITGVVDTADKHSFEIIPGNFLKKLKRSKWDSQGPGGHWFMKKKLK